MSQEKVIDDLFNTACPSIQYRIRHEILGELVTNDEMQALHGQILEDDAVRGILATQAADGWLGQRFHGYDSLEAGIRLLREKGVSSQYPALARALEALEADPDRATRDMGKVGKVLDERGLGGVSMIRATVFAYAGIEKTPQLQEQIQAALEGFRGVLKIKSKEETAEAYRKKMVFRPGIIWPSIYHLRLLAFTHAWRDRQNLGMLAEAIQRLVELSPLPQIYVLHKSQIIAPASFGMQDFNPVMESMKAEEWMMWFQRMELLARLGVVARIPELCRQLDTLGETLAIGDGWFTKPVNHAYFKKWGAYTGLMLERDWKNPQHRIFDLTFRSLLIRHYAMIYCE
jgi:hypothetical protein